jgi:hypothetical protein
MVAEGQKDASLIENSPHSAGDIFLHVLPPVSAWIVVIIILQYR